MEREGQYRRAITIVTAFLLISTAFFLLTINTSLETNAINGGDITILEVGPDEVFTTITDALEASYDGDTIKVYPGIYQENIIIDRSVKIIGTDPNTTIIDGSGQNSTFKISHDHVSLISLTIQYSGKNETSGKSGLVAYESGVWVEAKHLNIIDCNFRNNSRTSIYVDYQGDYLYVQDCDFQGYAMNHIRFGTKRIGHISILNNVFHNSGYQMVFYGPDDVTDLLVAGNIFIDDVPGRGVSNAISISLRNSYESLVRAVFANNYFNGNEYGIYLHNGEGVEIHHNTFENSFKHAIGVEDSGDVVIHNNNFIDCNEGSNQGENKDPAVNWNNSEGSGNYWSDYTSRYPGATNDGHSWNVPYMISGSALTFDLHPLVDRTDNITLEKYPPVAPDPHETIRVKCNRIFHEFIDVFDPDTPLRELTFTLMDGPEWLSVREGGTLFGSVPSDEDIGITDVEVQISDGDHSIDVIVPLEVVTGPSLVGYWNFDGSNSANVEDLSGFGHHGTLKNGAELIPGLNGKALYINSSANFVECETSSALFLGSEYTISFFLYPRSNDTYTSTFLQMGKKYQEDFWSILVYWDYRETVTMSIEGKSLFLDYFKSGSSIPIDQWTHIAFTFDGDLAKIYVNGELDLTYKIDIELPFSEGSLYFGDVSTYGYFGAMDEIRMYNYPLDMYEIQDIFSDQQTQISTYTFSDRFIDTSDTDDDSLPDDWEIDNFGDLDEDPYDDADEDGFTNLKEYLQGSDPMDQDDPIPVGDRDMDGLPDSWEFEHFRTLYYGPYDDFDDDGFNELEELRANSDPTDINDPNPMSDHDTLPDDWEIRYFGNCTQDPENDFDGDGYTESEEYRGGTDPTDLFDHPSSHTVEIDPEPDPDDPNLFRTILIVLISIVIFITMLAFILMLSLSMKYNKDDPKLKVKPIEKPPQTN